MGEIRGGASYVLSTLKLQAVSGIRHSWAVISGCASYGLNTLKLQAVSGIRHRWAVIGGCASYVLNTLKLQEVFGIRHRWAVISGGNSYGANSAGNLIRGRDHLHQNNPSTHPYKNSCGSLMTSMFFWFILCPGSTTPLSMLF